QDWMQKYSKTFACEQGVFKFASNDQQAAMLLNPPATPFAAIFSTKQQQHMIWRTPVSLSRDFFMVRVDGDVLTIRHPILMDALRIYKFAEKVMTDTVPAGRKKSLKGPAALFDRELQSSKMGMLRPDVDALMRETGNDAVIDQLHNLSMGEWWALNVIRHYDPAQPPPWQNALLAVDAAA
ncbi:CRISPR-associated protein, Csf1 family, partial [mine drainage metagenome]